MTLRSQGSDCAKMLSLRAPKQSIDDFTLDQAAEKWNVLRRLKQVHQPGTCVQELDRSDTYRHAAGISRLLAQMKLLLRENLPDHRHFESEQQTEHRFPFSCRDHLADNGKIDRRQQEVRTVAYVSRFANVDPLLSLHEDNQTGFVCSRGTGGGQGTAIEAQAWYLSKRVSFRNGTIGNLPGQYSPHLNHTLICARVLAFCHFHRLPHQNQVNAQFTILCTKMYVSTEIGNRLAGLG